MATEVAQHTFHVYRYRTFTKTIRISDITSHAGVSVRMMIKTSAESATSLLTLTSTPAAGIVLSTVSSQLNIAITMTDTQAGALAIDYGEWDLEVTKSDGTLRTYVGGPIEIHDTVTH